MAGTGPPNLNLHIYNPKKSRKEASKPISDDDWLLHQQRIVDLYINQDLRLKDVIEQMSEFEGFDASKMQYKKKFHEWNIQKYSRFSSKQVKYMVQKMLYRHHLEGKEKTGFRLNGVVLDWFRTRRKLKDAVKKGEVDVPSLFTDYPPLSPGELSPFTPEGHGCEFQELRMKFWPRFSPTSSRRGPSRTNSGMTNLTSSTCTTTTTTAARHRRHSVASDNTGMTPSRRSTGFSQSSGRSSQHVDAVRTARRAPIRQNTATSIMSVMQQIPENIQAVPQRHQQQHSNLSNHHHHNRITSTHHSSDIYLHHGQQQQAAFLSQTAAYDCQPQPQPLPARHAAATPSHLTQTYSYSTPSLPLNTNRFTSLRQVFQRYLNISHPHGDLLSVDIVADQGPRAVRIRISCQHCNIYGNKIAFIPPGTTATSTTAFETAITSSFHILADEFTQEHILTADHRALVDASILGSSAHVTTTTMAQDVGNFAVGGASYTYDSKFDNDFDYDPKGLTLLKTDTGFQSYMSGYSDNDAVYSAGSFVSSPVSMKMAAAANEINWEEWTRNIEESSYLAN